MNICCYRSSPGAPLAGKLDEFERQFTYPLGGTLRFRITHGPDYLRFFESVGDAACFVAQRGEDVLGVICVALVRVTNCEGVEERAAYFGDLKVRPGTAAGMAAVKLLQHSSRWALERVNKGLAVVMAGTAVLPTDYTGRLGIPPFRELARVAILRLPIDGAMAGPTGELAADTATVDHCFRRLTRHGYAIVNGRPEHRSATTPVPLATAGGTACGLLEDTRRAKRLFVVGGDEMISAHLSCFASSDPASGAQLLRAALALGQARRFPALFVAVPQSRVSDLLAALALPDVVRADAIVFGHGWPDSLDWYVHTAEI